MSKKIICVANEKGGVGKTTTTLTLAHGLALDGNKVLVIDFDPQGQCATALGMEPEANIFGLLVNPNIPAAVWVRFTGRDNLYLIPGDGSTATAQIVFSAEGRPLDAIAKSIKSLAEEYDYIIFDTSPSKGGLQERALWASTHVVIPVSTEYLSLDSLVKTLGTMNALAEKSWPGHLLGILPTLYDSVTNESANAIAYLKDHFPNLTLSPIRRATIMRECASEGTTIWEKNPASHVAKDYRHLVDVIKKS